jgi:hypothetical protein
LEIDEEETSLPFSYNLCWLLNKAVQMYLMTSRISENFFQKPMSWRFTYVSNFNRCFTVHFDKFKAFLPTNALVIKT